MRVELNRPVREEQHVTTAVNLAKDANVDALYMPPVFLKYAAEQLGRSKITLVTTVARPEDLLDTKIAGVDAAVKDGADELIVCVPPHYIYDWDWNEMEKEIEQLKVVCSAYNKFLWIGCRFHYLDRVCQVKMAELIGEGAGLRLRDATLADVSIANICGVKRICLGVGDEPEYPMIDNFISHGVTQFVFQKKPPQKKVEMVHVHEV